MLVFGPQCSLPQGEAAEDLRQVLVSHPQLEGLRAAVNGLPALWHDLTQADPELRHVPGDTYLRDLVQWMETGDLTCFDHEFNTLSFPLMTLLQIALYVRYLALLQEQHPYERVRKSLEYSGVHGFCLGFLSAAAVAQAETEADLAVSAAVSIRLAVCVGAYVDKDSVFAQPVRLTASMAVRWRNEDTTREEVDQLLQKFPQTYVSCVNDESCITVTVPIEQKEQVTNTLQVNGLRVRPVDIQGRFHTATHAYAITKLQEFCQTANWYKTIQGAINDLPDVNRTIVFAGFGDSPIPFSLLREKSTHIISLWNKPAAPLPPKNVPPHQTQLADDMTLYTSPTADSVLQGTQYPPHSVAVVGMACRFAGAESVDEFWKLLLSGKSMATSPPVDRLPLNDLRVQDRADIQWWGNFIQNPDTFDHRFFKKSAREALFWDPEKRLILEVVYQALESSGYFGVGCESNPKDYGCYIGAVANNYYDNVSCHPPTAYSMLGTSRAFFSGRISHQFGFTGPSMTIDTACSSSLVAINAACKSIQHGECSRAIAGGTNVFTSPFDYQNLAAAGFLSPSGPCKPFDASADGYCRGEGVGAVVLKSLDKAIEEGDHILGVIVGSAVNQNDNDSHITVPCSASQTAAYKQVLKLADTNSESVSYVEAHGTGTQVGDPIECQSIRDAFGGPKRDNTLYFGSVKGHIGHTEAAAGVAGLVKVLLMMHHQTIPGQASFSKLNPKIPDLQVDRMAIPGANQPWDASSRLACINSYGAAGSNAVVALREGPKLPAASAQLSRPICRYPLVLSAMSQKSLSMYADEVLKYVASYPTQKEQSRLVADFVFNLTSKANPTLPYTVAESVETLDDLRSILGEVATGSRVFSREEFNKEPRPVVLVFGGQDSEMVGLSKELYARNALFRDHLDACDAELQNLGFGSLQPAIFQSTPIANLTTLHAAFFAVQYASAKCWIDCGLKVNAVVGHTNLMVRHWGPERGSMISVNGSREKVTELVGAVNAQGDNHIEVACYNGPNSHVLVGSTASIELLESVVASNAAFQDSMRLKRLKVTHGFHSKYTEKLLPRLTDLAKSLTWNSPSIYLETCTEEQSMQDLDFRLIPEHTRKPVFFHQAIGRIVQRFPQCTWLEAGHGSSIVQLLRGCLGSSVDADQRVFASPLTAPNSSDLLSGLTLDLWKAGHPVQFWAFHQKQKHEHRFLTMPPYQFEKNQHWLPFIKSVGVPTPTGSSENGLEDVGHEFISFAGYNGSIAGQARFIVDPESERYRMLLNGHITSGQALAPVSLYIELISRAALLLHPDADAYKSHVSRIESLQMKTAIGLDSNKYVVLDLTPVSGDSLAWEFEISSRPKGQLAVETADSSVHTTGVVSLAERKNSKLAQMFKRYEALIGSSRCKEILDHPEAEKMQGKHIYQAIQRLVFFDPMYQGMKSIASVGHEAAGKVMATVNPALAPHERLYDAPLIDGLMQYAGVLVNYFTHPSQDEVMVCLGIDRIETGGNFNPDAHEWNVYAVLTEDTEQTAECDVYVFDGNTGQLVFTFLGFHFMRTLQSVLTRSLRDVNAGQETAADMLLPKLTAGIEPPILTPTSQPFANVNIVSKPLAVATSKRDELLSLINRITDIPLDEILDDSTLDDLGIDSLLVTEVVNEVKTAFGLDIDMNTFLFFPNVKAVYTYLDTQLGVPGQATANGQSSVDRPGLSHARDAFDEIQHAYDRLAVGTKAVNFWRDAYPRQASLILAYVVEAWAKLGCDLNRLAPGEVLPDVPHLPRHKQLIRQLHRVLEDANLVIENGAGGFIRTSNPIDPTPASQIFTEILDEYPEHANVHKLVQVTGSELAGCLTGEKDGLQLVFGDKVNKKNLDDVYENWPLVRTGTLVLGEYLTTLFSRPDRPGKFRILEIGAGTGGTTKYIVDHLQRHNIPFEYVFTDLSSSLVGAGKRNFKNVPGMEFRVMDIEKDPEAKDLSSFHVVISTNCIHATQNLTHSLTNIRRMLRDDGVVTLVEITRNMFWLDIAVGLFEGWWLFNDGREHAVTNEHLWDQCMRKAGFQDVAWTSGEEPESNTIRIVAGFAQSRE
ncbi:hypothetical protein P175DRAFT_0469512 [Aspergillus ochraceoroseus IBT 24754]|uniref:Uncharacterized protein n=1 Tax=Aspergillus ochraceoroseus IBT 24754 TaxID=1392256 RepID=A0A2T5M604_9EURO|nr:uncharacterized protein P175DRAFT_0469512 [Aspergillus ochraceoroseus IBT 24754]PTU23969.1 hypothetical protein P175DRAFT_0469512 [Aspergillus ochraceoroseus IBT 24754]